MENIVSNGTSWDLSTDTSETDIRSLATFHHIFSKQDVL